MSNKSTLDTMIESGEFTIDFSGHFLSGNCDAIAIPTLAREKAKVLECLELSAFRDGVLVGLAIAGQRSIALESRLHCPECGATLEIKLAGKTLKAAPECSFPRGVALPFEAILDVPSGRLAFEDSFEFLEEPKRDRAVAPMTIIDTKLGFEAWSASGFPKAGCGSSNPGVYRRGNRLLIASFDAEKNRAPKGYKRVASIATGYWSWQCGDFDRLAGAAAKAGKVLATTRVVKVAPGRYKVSVHSIHCDHKGPHFASIEPIQEAGDLRD